MKTNSSTFETEGREHFIPVGRAGRGTSLCRAMASPLLKKGLDIFKEQNIHNYRLPAKMCCKHYNLGSKKIMGLWTAAPVESESLKPSKTVKII